MIKPHTLNDLENLFRILKKHEEDVYAARKPVLNYASPQTIKAFVKGAWEPEGQPLKEILADFEQQVLPYCNFNPHPNYMAYITGGANPAGALAEYAKGFLNQNGLKWNSSPISVALEELVCQWVGNFINYPHKLGIITSGGSMSNYLALDLALANRFPERKKKGLYGQPPFVVYVSEQGHSSVDRAVDKLGLGTDFLRKIPVNRNFEMIPDLLNQAMERDITQGLTPLAVVATLGTTNTGATDPVRSIAAIAGQYNTWLHVDGAYGAPAAALEKFHDTASALPQADSLAVNPHKWLYVPFEASMVLLKNEPIRDPDVPDYLRDMQDDRKDLSAHTIELSKEFRSLKIWMTLKYFGQQAMKDAIQHDLNMTALLAQKLQQETSYRVLAPYPMSVLCFRYENQKYTAQQLETMNQNILQTTEQEGKVFLTGTRLHGKTALRTCFINLFRTKDDITYLVNYLQELAQRFG